MKKKTLDNLPIIEPSQFMREMWAAEAEFPVFAGSLLNLRFMAAGAGTPRPKRKVKARAKALTKGR